MNDVKRQKEKEEKKKTAREEAVEPTVSSDEEKPSRQMGVPKKQIAKQFESRDSKGRHDRFKG